MWQYFIFPTVFILLSFQKRIHFHCNLRFRICARRWVYRYVEHGVVRLRNSKHAVTHLPPTDLGPQSIQLLFTIAMSASVMCYLCTSQLSLMAARTTTWQHLNWSQPLFQSKAACIAVSICHGSLCCSVHENSADRHLTQYEYLAENKPFVNSLPAGSS